MQVIILTFFASVIPTLLGGMLGFKAAKNSISLAYLLSLSSGLMLAMVAFDFMVHSLHEQNVFVSSFIILLTIAIMLLIEAKFHHHDIDTKHDLNDFHHHHLEHIEKTNLIKTSLLMTFSVAIHNFPEGLAIGTSFITNPQTAVILAILLFIHNVPEGMGMIVPLIKAKVSKLKALMIIGLSGISTIVGAFLGYSLKRVAENWVSVGLSIASGCMLYVIFFELIPQVQMNDHSKKHLLIMIIGFILGFILLETGHMH
ncbi:MAG: ZIP family metal transporter [Erysipelotrichaceae bacterium]|nr:ZIP family metal transporter [Erysipelotrichaceae bacterium]MDY5252357.1 ZIP family metal transporter [Erysipelotrichaceae bacterium]